MSRSTGSTEHTITAVSEAAGVSSRTLRYYADIGLLLPTSTGAGGIRRYDDHAVVRLQRILLLRGLGLALDDIRRVIDGESDDVAALTAHVDWLEQERDRIARQLAAVRTTIRRLQEGHPMDTISAFDGFDQNRYRQEVEERWGRSEWERGADWWERLSADEKASFQDEQRAIAAAAAALAASGAAPDSHEALALARRQFAWLAVSTPVETLTEERFRTLADMYVLDERFSGAFESAGVGAAQAIHDSMHALADRGL